MNDNAWEGTVLKKSNGLLDGSNMYRRVKVRLSDGTTTTVRVDRDLWEELIVGDAVVTRPGQKPVKARRHHSD